MKKIIISILVSITLFSCSMLSIDQEKIVYVSEIKNVLSSKIDNEIDLKLVRGSAKIKQVHFNMNSRLDVVLELELRNALNAFLGMSGEKVQIIVDTDYILRNNQILTRDVRVSNVIGIEDSYILKDISSFIVNVLLENKVIYDFNEINRFKGKTIINILPTYNGFYVETR